MLDILHYLFESDSIGEKEEMDAKHRMRRSIYGQLYERSYTWGSETADYGSDRSYGNQPVAATPPTLTHKPYIPPTPVNANSPKPFGNVLDAPLG